MPLHFSSFPIGRTGTLPPKLVSRDETIAFAREFDPQPMHLDDAAAAKSLLGSISASGWHTCAMLMRMIWDGFLHETAGLGSPGIREVRWLKPVKPGDTLTGGYAVTDARLSAKRPDMGIVRIFYTLRNQDGAPVMTWDCTQFFVAASSTRSGRLPAGAAGATLFAASGRLPGGESEAASKDAGTPAGNLFLEDYTPGLGIELGSHTFTAEAITAFARLYDPQPFHLDEAAAARTYFGGLSASGWHTAAVWMQLMVAWQFRAVRAVLARGDKPGKLGPSPGFRDMRWREPVRPGDTLTYSTRVTGAEDWPGRPAWGLMTMHNEGRNQHGRAVFSFEGRVLIERRTPLPG